MGRELVCVIINPEIEDKEQYVDDILNKYISFNENILLSLVDIKKIFDNNQYPSFKEFCNKHSFEYDDLLDKNTKFPILWQYYDEFSNNEIKLIKDMDNYANIFIDENGLYHEFDNDDNLKFIKRPEIEYFYYIHISMKI